MDSALTQAGEPPSLGTWYRTSWAYLVVIVLAVIAVYGQTIGFDFVTYDDTELVTENQSFLSSWSNALTAFTTHAFTTHRAESGYYRPLLLVSYLADYQLWGLHPAGFHMMNVALHLLTCLLVFGICGLLLLGDRVASLFGALLFALHPLQSESVGWVAGRNDLLLGLFVAGMVAAYLGYRRSAAPRRSHLVLALLCFGASLFTKESAAFYLLLLPLIDLAVPGAGRPVRRYLPFVALLLVYLAVRASVIGALVGAERLYATTALWQRVAAAPALVAEHVRLIVAPAGLSVAHPVEELWLSTAPGMVVSALVVVGCFAAAVWAWRHDRVLALGLSWIGIGLLPAMNVLPLAVPVLEHRLYVPLAGGAVALAALIRRLARDPRWKGAVLAGVAALLAAAGFATLFRLPVWANSESLWLDTIAKAPSYTRSYLNLAGYYYEQGRFDLAAALLEESLRRRPDDQFASSKLRMTYVAMGQPVRAVEVSRRMISNDPANPARYLETATLFEQLRMADSAAAVCSDALRAGVENGEVRAMLGRLLAERGDTAGALVHFRRAVELTPDSTPLRLRLGMLLWKSGDVAGAAQTLEAGLGNNPPNELLDGLTRLYMQTGQDAKARALLDRYAFR